ncbi:hypothetical protein ABCR94_38905 [Streptomyces sp. 21So2-11]|uniref:hypothetical protein n=1 Tax=Streptomyces sp. 21So2-11 TaxID=3144408 RepID=UPI00321A16E6
MRNVNTGAVVLAKVDRSYTFILGKSSYLEREAVLQLSDGRVGLYFVRRNGETGFVPMLFTTFDNLVVSKRAFEREYLTGELSEDTNNG